MTVNVYVRAIDIVQQEEVVIDFLSKTKNLLQWVKFFKNIHKERNNYCKFETPFGLSTTTVKMNKVENNFVLFINSKFFNSKNRESAFINIFPKDNKISVEFNLRLPKALSDLSVKSSLLTLEQELLTLKNLLEE